jgi:hypothetical protein
MYKKSLLQIIIVFGLIIFLGFNLKAQVTVSTLPLNKNILIERGTGHVCGSCPHITLRCDSVLDTYPGRGMMIEYHFGPDAIPQAGFGLQTDYRTPYGDSILSWPFYLNMMMNRRDRGVPYGSTYIFGTNDNQIKKEADLIVTQSSEVNLAMSSSFNATTRLLTVNVQAYYTANSATTLNFIQVAITEDSLISTQYDGDYAPNSHFNLTFNHPNVFRANMNGFWGDSVKTTTSGTTISRTYTYTLPTTPYKWNANHCKLTMYVTESKNASGIQSFAGKVITAIRSDIGGVAASGVDDKTITTHVIVYPNPSTGQIYVSRDKPGEYSVEVFDALGKKVYTASKIKSSETLINLSGNHRGIYFVRVNSEKEVSTTKIILVD